MFWRSFFRTLVIVLAIGLLSSVPPRSEGQAVENPDAGMNGVSAFGVTASGMVDELTLNYSVNFGNYNDNYGMEDIGRCAYQVEAKIASAQVAGMRPGEFVLVYNAFFSNHVFDKPTGTGTYTVTYTVGWTTDVTADRKPIPPTQFVVGGRMYDFQVVLYEYELIQMVPTMLFEKHQVEAELVTAVVLDQTEDGVPPEGVSPVIE